MLFKVYNRVYKHLNRNPSIMVIQFAYASRTSDSWEEHYEKKVSTGMKGQ